MNKNQEGNPILKHICNVPWEFGDTLGDYQVGKVNAVLFLSLRYHRLHPNYIYERLRELGKNYTLRILLVLVDIKDPEKSTRELTRVSFLLNFTILLAWNSEEAGKYIETLKAYENKPLDGIKKKRGNSFLERTSEFFTSAPSINKTDSTSLIRRFGSLTKFGERVNENTLQNIPGIGPNKISQLLKFLDSPLIFKNNDDK